MAQLATQNIKAFVDLDLDFDTHPNTKRLNVITGDEAVVRALKNLINTNHYERPFHPEIGCNLRATLFENISQSTAMTIRNIIEEAINNYEPRVSLINVSVQAKSDENGYYVTLEFFIVNREAARRLDFFLERIR